MILSLLAALAFADPAAATVRGRVDVGVALLPGKASGVVPQPSPGRALGACPAEAAGARTTRADGSVLDVVACAAGVFWSVGEGGPAFRLAGAAPDGEPAGVALLSTEGAEALALVWTTSGDLRLTAWAPVDPAPFVLRPRVLPAGPPLDWPEPATPSDARVPRAQVDARLPEGARVGAARLDGKVAVLDAEVRLERGRARAELWVPLPPG